MKKNILIPIIGLSIFTLASCNFAQGGSSTTIVESSSTPSSTSQTTIPQISGSTSTNIPSSSTTPASSSSSTKSSTFSSRSTATQASYSSIAEDNNGINITEVVGYNEAAYLKFVATNTEYNAYYKEASSSSFTKIDNELIRINNDEGRIDVLGLKPGNYLIKVEDKNNPNIYTISNSVVVTKQDRSGYAHFNYNSGVGAYNDDGTLKNNAVVVYVNENNKNTVKAEIAGTEYTGLSDILKHSTNSSYPVDIRIIGRVGAATWSSASPSVSIYDNATNQTVEGINDEYLELRNYDEEAIIAGGYNELDTSTYAKLNGLTNKIKYDGTEFDSYYNMLDISGAKNVTVEGVGIDAEIYQWGFTWKSDCKSIEVKNLTFTDYTEDACSFEGSGQDANLNKISAFTSTRYWIHNNTFNRGKNYWDVCSEQDKHDGDGSTDLKRVAYVTLSYNEYYNNHKTGLVGGSDSQMTSCVTFHHNYYNQCQSRLPFARQANMHMYNNYYYKSSGNNMQIYAGAYAFIENSYFKDVKNTFNVSDRGLGTAAVKSYNSTFDNSPYSGATIVESRTEAVNNQNVFSTTFDMDSDIFYFDTNDNISDVSLMLQTDKVPTYIPIVSGAGKLVALDYSLHTTEHNDPYVDSKVKAQYTTNTPLNSGLYYQAINAGLVIQEESSIDDSTIVKEDNGTIYVTDTSSTLSTIGYYVLNNNDRVNAGKVTYSMEITLTGVGSKWNFLRFLDNDGDEVLAIRAATDTKNIAYTLDEDDSTETIIKNTPFKAGTYKITLTIDYSSSSAILKVGDYQTKISSFNYTIGAFKFMTAIKATDRSFTVKNITITKES